MAFSSCEEILKALIEEEYAGDLEKLENYAVGQVHN